MVQANFTITPEIEEQDYGKFIVEPLAQGYGHTLGVSLRRVLLSSLKGAAVTQVKIAGVRHQFSTLPGLKEDIVELILNIKKLRLSYDGDKPITMRLDVKGKRIVTAADIVAPPQVTIADKEIYLGELTSDKAKLEIVFWVESGFGYVPSEERKVKEIGIIPIDALFSPIRRVNYKVEATRVGRMTNLDKLIMEIWTDKSIKPRAALEEASRILASYFKQIYAPVEHKEEKIKKAEDKKIPAEIARLTLEELELPTRVANALRNGGIDTVGDLLKTTKEKLVKIKNVGAKSLNLVDKELNKKGLKLRSEKEEESEQEEEKE